MERIDTALPGVFLIKPKVFEDARGFFFETYHRDKMKSLGISEQFVQDNHSKSLKGTLRGLHFQVRYPQAKLCRVIQGAVLDVAVDIRPQSPHFGKWVGVVLSAENREEIYIPRGFAHGFLVLSDTAEFLYKCDEIYHPDDESGIIWNDPEIGINWGISDPILSNKDRSFPKLSVLKSGQLPTYP